MSLVVALILVGWTAILVFHGYLFFQRGDTTTTLVARPLMKFQSHTSNWSAKNPLGWVSSIRLVVSAATCDEVVTTTEGSHVSSEWLWAWPPSAVFSMLPMLSKLPKEMADCFARFYRMSMIPTPGDRWRVRNLPHTIGGIEMQTNSEYT